MKIIPKNKSSEFNLIGKQIVRENPKTPSWIDKALKHKWK